MSCLLLGQGMMDGFWKEADSEMDTSYCCSTREYVKKKKKTNIYVISILTWEMQRHPDGNSCFFWAH